MANIAGLGRKRPLLNIPYSNLKLDPLNPRLPEDVQGKKEEEICYALYRFFDTEELAYSMSENGYFDEEPLVAIPENLPSDFENFTYEEYITSQAYLSFINDPATKFIVVEGNRRLSTIKLLLDSEFRSNLKIRNFPEITKEVEDDISVLPVIIYPNRKEVLPYLGVRHISGIKKWEPYAKARYVAKMVEQGFSIDDIQKQVGDRSNSARKIYLCYQLIEAAKYEFDLNTEKAENLFSYLLLASGQGSIKEYLGIEKRIQDVNLEKPVPANKLENLKNLFSWLFGEGREIMPVIKESRDITSKLSPVLRIPEATEYLKITRDLSEAYERSDGEDELLKRNFVKANRLLSQSLGYINDKNSEEIKTEVNKLQEILSSILSITKYS
ncbi:MULTISPECIES: hypothetical protein [unclassified Flavobacterium]|uniref:hypothetical protein n=1 Tax=unclassified Flavobacterium TaxID=196869 RepID=UPI003F8F3C70